MTSSVEHDSTTSAEYDESMSEHPMFHSAHVGLDADGYVSYMGSTPTPDSTLVIIPESFDTQYLPAYKIMDGTLVLDEQRKQE